MVYHQPCLYTNRNLVIIPHSHSSVAMTKLSNEASLHNVAARHASQHTSAHGQRWRSTTLSNPPAHQPTHAKELDPPPVPKSGENQTAPTPTPHAPSSAPGAVSYAWGRCPCAAPLGAGTRDPISPAPAPSAVSRPRWRLPGGGRPVGRRHYLSVACAAAPPTACVAIASRPGASPACAVAGGPICPPARPGCSAALGTGHLRRVLEVVAVCGVRCSCDLACVAHASCPAPALRAQGKARQAGLRSRQLSPSRRQLLLWRVLQLRLRHVCAYILPAPALRAQRQAGLRTRLLSPGRRQLPLWRVLQPRLQPVLLIRPALPTLCVRSSGQACRPAGTAWGLNCSVNPAPLKGAIIRSSPGRKCSACRARSAETQDPG